MKNRYDILGDTSIVYCNHKGKEIPVQIDTSDLELVMSFRNMWCVTSSKQGRKQYVKGYYVPESGGPRQGIFLHRFILQCSDDLHVDHVDNDGLNNRRFNLRAVTHAENLQNYGGRGTSGYRGVVKSGDKYWSVTIRKKYYGCFRSREEAIAKAERVYQQIMPYAEFAKGAPNSRNISGNEMLSALCRILHIDLCEDEGLLRAIVVDEVVNLNRRRKYLEKQIVNI